MCFYSFLSSFTFHCNSVRLTYCIKGYLTWLGMLVSQRLLPAIRRISGEFFIFQLSTKRVPQCTGRARPPTFFWTRDSCIRLDRFVAAKQYHPQSSGLQNPGALAGCFQESGAPSRTRDDLWDKRKSGEKCAIGGGWVVNECPVKVIFVPMAKHFMYFASAENLQKDRHITSKCAILFLKCITQTGNNNAGMCTAHAKKKLLYAS